MSEYAAWERGDAEAAWQFYADDVVMNLPGRGSLAGAHVGRANVIAAIRRCWLVPVTCRPKSR